MPKIRILPDQLANQIAAGEVVERPASVVKELLENSLDAGADSIQIEVSGGGTRLIKVIDNGEGMDEDDVLLCLERHGTSKISDHDDLSEIKTLGFRGEALPSIASVSKLIISSRRRENDLGTTLVCHYGVIKKVHEVGAHFGTTIEISNLFGNTPARRKFLRTKRTELAHIEDTVRNYCLARPDVAFSFRIDDRIVLNFDTDCDLASRLAALCNFHGEFIEVISKGSSQDALSISGLLVSPETSVPAASRLRTFVNGRAVKDRMLSHAVNEGMRSFLLKGRAPAGMISVELPPMLIDVNVHPAKHEIRFRNSRAVHERVSKAVRTALLEYQQRVRHDIFSAGPENTISDRDHSELDELDRSLADSIITKTENHQYDSGQKQQRVNQPLAFPTAPSNLSTAEPISAYLTPADTQPNSLESFEDEVVQIEDLLVIGSFKDLYIFCRNRDKLIVIDQHAVHERLLFEDFNRQYKQGKIASQQLLFPVSIELSTFQSSLVEKYENDLEAMGFALRPFGGNTWILGAVPALAGANNPQDLFLNLLEQFGSEKDSSDGNAIVNILATMACKAAVKSGDHLTDQEIRALLKRMIKANLFSHCPHGRPVVKIFDGSDLKKWFYRT